MNLNIAVRAAEDMGYITHVFCFPAAKSAAQTMTGKETHQYILSVNPPPGRYCQKRPGHMHRMSYSLVMAVQQGPGNLHSNVHQAPDLTQTSLLSLSTTECAICVWSRSEVDNCTGTECHTWHQSHTGGSVSCLCALRFAFHAQHPFLLSVPADLCCSATVARIYARACANRYGVTPYG
jgi:hypothetical protein